MELSALIEQLEKHSISSAAPRESGVVDMVNMKWNSSACQLTNEYRHIYISRLQKMRERFELSAVTSISRLIQNKQTYTIHGIIKRIEADRVRAFQKQFKEKYANEQPIFSQKDELQIEDSTGKIILALSSQCTMLNRKIKMGDLPYGISMMVEGKFYKQSNRFYVKNMIPPCLAIQHKYENNTHNQSYQRKMLILSQPDLEMLQRLSNQLDCTYSMEVISIVTVVIIGGMELNSKHINRMSQIINELKQKIDVFIMPSSNQQRNQLFPLQPYNGIFFIKSQRQIGLCSNPQRFQTQNGLQIHVSCGQNVKDMMKNGAIASNQLQAMQMMINFAHYCPTSPFSLRSQPYMQDYMVMDELPHIMITGKSRSFMSRHLKMQGKQVLLLAIPQGQVGLVNLDRPEATRYV